MNAARKPGPFALFLLAAACVFTSPHSCALGQMHRHNDSDFKNLEETVGRQEKHIEADDIDIKEILARLGAIEGIARGLSYAIGSGVFYAAARLFQKKRDSA